MANMISTGCTVTNSFTLPVPPSQVAALFITYQQEDTTVLEKQLSEVEFDPDDSDNRITVRLSQQDTLRFDPANGAVRIQLRLRTRRDTAIKSRVLTAAVDELLKKGVI